MHAARLCAGAHFYPKDFRPSLSDAFWEYSPETETIGCHLSSKKRLFRQPEYMLLEVGFVPGTARVNSVTLRAIDPTTGEPISGFVGYSPYVNGGNFVTQIDFEDVLVNWDDALQTVHYYANAYADPDNPAEQQAIAALRRLGQRHGAEIGRSFPGLTELDPNLTSITMIGRSAGPDTAFARHLRTCMDVAARGCDPEDIEMLVINNAVVANLWATYGDVIEARFVYEPKVIPVDFRRGTRTDVPAEAQEVNVR